MAFNPDYDGTPTYSAPGSARPFDPTGGASTTPTTPTPGMPPGIDPRLAALYSQYGVTPGGAGSGLTDWSYWQNDAVSNAGGDWNYVLDRLGSDFAGTGPDKSGGASSGEGGGGTMGPFTPSTPTSQWSADPRTNDLYNTLLGRSGQSLQIGANDPIIRNQTDNFQAAEARQQKGYLADLAEQGGGGADLSMEKRMSSEKIGQDTANFQGTLENNELMARRQEIQDSLSQMGSLLSDQEKMDLQNQLAIMDNLLGQAGLQQGAFQFDATQKYLTSPLGGGF
jgi:hypothetical protein